MGRHFLQIPGPTNVPEQVLRAISLPTIDHRGPEFQALGRRLLDKIKPVFGTGHPVLMFPATGTGAWEAALVNTLSPGDRVLCYETGHFATLWQEMARALGLVVDFVPGDWRHGVDPVDVEQRLRADTGHEIRAVCVVHNETSTGVTSRVAEVRAAIDAADHPALFLVDTISSLGSIDYRHDEWKVDVTVAGSQKGLMLPPGMSFNAVSDKALAASRSAGLARSVWDWGPMLKANENGFFTYTPSTNLMYGLDVALDMLYEEGLENVFARHQRHAAATRAAVREWGLEVLCLDEREHSGSLTAVLMPDGHDADELRRIILERYDMSLGSGLSKLAGKVFRIGHLGAFNDLMLAGTLCGVQMGLHNAGVPVKGNGVDAALQVLSHAMTELADLAAATSGELAREAERLLRAELEGEVQFDDYSRHLFARDASMYSIMPMGVVFPRHADDVAATVRVANRLGVVVTPRGAGTSLAGQTIGPGIVLDCSRHLNRIIELDPEARTARVEVGVVQDELNGAAAPFGLMFGPDTSTSNRATIGGMFGNNSAGSGSVRYGMTIDHVRAADVVLADGSRARFEPVDEVERRRRATADTLEGRIYRRLPEIVEANREAIATGFPPFWRRACGYRLDRLADGSPFDLATFVVGSEGTLVIATEVEVGLVAKPKHTVFAVGHFDSTQGAVEATTDALSCDPAQVELMDKTILDLSRRKIEYADLGRSLAGDPAALLFVSFTGDDLDEVQRRLDALIDLWRDHGHGYHSLRAVTPAQQGALLKVRKASLGLLMAASEGANRPLAFVEDTAVPPERLADYTARFATILDEHQMRAGFYGHCSVGCLHIRPFVDLSRPDEILRMRAVAEKVKDLVREFGGVNSSEHGDGLARSEFNREIFGDRLYEAMRSVKQLFDPQHLLNPGKIVDAPPMTENLRDAALPPPVEFRTRLDFSVTGGMRGAADRCMNIGLCRKSTTGVMCPSYMATREEEHATRGRANALVKALTEADPAAALGDERLHEILDLCLMCKACKAECPLGVDMAKLKSETLAHHHDRHGVPLRSRVFAAIRRLNRLGSAAAPVSNLPGSVAPLRALLAWALGIAPQRPLPRFARQNLLRWFRRHRRAADAPAPTQGTVAFLADSFTSFTEPHIGRTAIGLLEAAGWNVELASNGCCGRAALSKGLLADAAAQARAMVTALAQGAAPDAPIVGCEPSCLFTLRDEHVAMLPGDPHVAAVAGRVRQFEELLSAAIDEGRLVLDPDSWLAGRRVLYHGHCHQKAEVGTAATTALLRKIPGIELVELDAGCCGMAGSFGYEAEHYAISMKVGADRLYPAIEAENPDTVVAATGTSCREQIAHGTGRRAWHPVELVAQALTRP